MAEDPKAPKAVALSGSKKKPLLIALAVIVLLAGVVAGFMLHQRNMEEYRDIADALLYRTHWLSSDQRKQMLAGAGTRGPKYLEIKDKDSFRKILAEQFQLMVEEKKMAGSSSFQNGVNECIAVLEEQGIQDEAIRTAYQGYMIEQKDALFSKFNTISLKQYFKNLQSADSAYYTKGIVTDSEVADHIRGKVGEGIASGDFETVGKALQLMADAGYTEVCYPDPVALLDTLMERCEVYAVGRGNNGYYEGVEDSSKSTSHGLDPAGMGTSIGTSSSSSTTKNFGDFSVYSYHSSTHYDGLVDQKSKNKYNKESSGTEFYFRGMDANGNGKAFQWAAEKGAQYAVCGRHEPEKGDDSGVDCVLLLNTKGLYIPGKTTSECYVIEGDFAASVKELRKLYQDTYSLDAWAKDAAAKLAAGDLDGALAAYRIYPKLVVSDDAFLEIAKQYLQAGENEKGIEALGCTAEFKGLEGVEDTVKRLSKYDPEHKYRDEFPQRFCRLMAQTLTPMTGEEIQDALIGKAWTSLPNYMYRFQSDGTGVDRDRFGPDRFTWSINGNTLALSYGASPVEFQVYNILDTYYYLNGSLHYLLTPHN